jgi:hypothetical protein
MLVTNGTHAMIDGLPVPTLSPPPDSIREFTETLVPEASADAVDAVAAFPVQVAAVVAVAELPVHANDVVDVVDVVDVAALPEQVADVVAVVAFPIKGPTNDDAYTVPDFDREPLITTFDPYRLDVHTLLNV